MVNQVMQTASIMASFTLSWGSPSLSGGPASDGSVLIVIPMVDTMMKVMEIMLTTCRGSANVFVLSHRRQIIAVEHLFDSPWQPETCVASP